jgi:predicted metallo-beta-lactamase superfamily hydrolase
MSLGRYVKPDTSDEYRATAQGCIDRAQRAMEVAEVNLDAVAQLFNLNENQVQFSDLIAHGEARTRLGMAWANLGEIKSLMDLS